MMAVPYAAVGHAGYRNRSDMKAFKLIVGTSIRDVLLVSHLTTPKRINYRKVEH